MLFSKLYEYILIYETVVKVFSYTLILTTNRLIVDNLLEIKLFLYVCYFIYMMKNIVCPVLKYTPEGYKLHFFSEQ